MKGEDRQNICKVDQEVIFLLFRRFHCFWTTSKHSEQNKLAPFARNMSEGDVTLRLRSLLAMKLWVYSWFDPLQVCADLISTIRGNVETGRAMKVRWNACYAASNCLKPLALFRDKRTSDERAKLIKALLPLVEDFPNFKVRTYVTQEMNEYWLERILNHLIIIIQV